jgi:hypothetical protein
MLAVACHATAGVPPLIYPGEAMSFVSFNGTAWALHAA